MERDSARGEIQPGLKILARFGQTLELFQQASQQVANKAQVTAQFNTRLPCQALKKKEK